VSTRRRRPDVPSIDATGQLVYIEDDGYWPPAVLALYVRELAAADAALVAADRQVFETEVLFDLATERRAATARAIARLEAGVRR
jgi:hypothetical protein